MADLAVGLAKSVVEGALTKAQSAIEEDSKLRQSAQRDLVFITGEFQMMQSFLKLADDERTRNIVVRTWVRQIRELAYDVEDCIEFVLHLDNKSRWKAYSDPESCQNFACRAWVKLAHPFNPHDFIRGLTAQFYANTCQELHEEALRGVLTRSEATQDDYLKEFVRQVNDVRYLIVLEDLSTMAEWDAIRTFLPDKKNGSWIIVSTQQFEIASLCVGHSYQVLELKQFSADHSVYAFREGSQGDREKAEERPAEQGVSSENILTCKNSAATEWMQEYPIIGRESEMNELHQHTTFARFHSFQVISVWGIAGVGKSALSKKEWDLIKAALLPRSSKKSVIIAITSEASIATCCADKEELIFNVKGLQADAASSLFHQEVQRKNPDSSLKDLREEEAAKLHEVILKCGGLPQVIVEIAGILAKKTVTLMDTVGSTNDRFMHTLENNPEYDSLQGLFSWMYSYFRSCPDSLKPCIFYMSLFPRDQSPRRRRVVRRWVAEGYSRDSEDNSAEQNGEKFFSNLLDLSIIQHPPQLVTATSGDRRMISCRVNGFIREYIVSRRMEENLVFELEGCCEITTQRTGRHLIIRESWDRDKIVFENMDFSKLRSLTVFGKWRQFFVSESMKLLRVLDLEDSLDVQDADLEKMLKLLRRLKFLSLRGCREIHHLPSSVGDLRQLQTLDIRHTLIVNLPGNIKKLQKLQYIRAGTSIQAQESSTPCLSVPKFCGRHRQFGVMVPRGINKLTTLHTFGVVNIGASGGKAILKELKDLTQLRKLGVSGINRRNSKKFSSAISRHVHLESLSVQLDKGSQSCLSGIVLPLKTLQSFKLHGPVEKLPVLKIDELSMLTKLDLEMTILTEDDIKLIGSLSKLFTLRIKLLQDSKVHFCVKEAGLEVPTYQMVKVLDIGFNSNFEVTFGTNTMRSLELIKAHCCNGSSVKFSGLNNVTELKVLLLKGCCDNALKEELESQLAQHPNEPVLEQEE
ncbi:putative disease resistance protein RXW24L [Triticum urartu]|uniref:Putative disease resistance protein RXW24L n=1 Tax=Triticum urartu TaxID=4572 RepID=M8A9R1_TRIUA|nr:putative disease resistance protein RXW24L [Triticum urartu]